MNDVTYKWDEPRVVLLPQKDLLDSQLNEYEQKKEALKLEIHNLTRELTPLTDKLKVLSTDVYNHNQMLREVMKNIEQKQNVTSSLTEKICTLNAEIVTLKKEKETYTSCAKEIKEAQEALYELQNKKTSILLEIDRLESKIDSLNTEYSLIHARIQAIKNEHQDLSKVVTINNRILAEISKEREHKEQVEIKISNQIKELDLRQKSIGVMIRPIQAKLDKQGIKLDFMKFIQDL